MVTDMFAASLGDIDLADEHAVTAAYDAHNAAVRATIPPDRLFEYQPGDGWAPLCAAVCRTRPARTGRTVPSHEHPRRVPLPRRSRFLTPFSRSSNIASTMF